MPEPALVFWIIGAPFIVAVVDLIRTRSAMRDQVPSPAGVWSESLKIDRSAGVSAGRR